MKKRIALDDIKAGQKFSADVYIDGQNLLVPANIAVEQKDLNALRHWGVTFVTTEGELLKDEEPAKAEGPAREGGALPVGFVGSRELFARYSSLVDKLGVIFGKIQSKEPLEPKVVDQLSQALLTLVGEERDAVVSSLLGTENRAGDLARAGINTAILSAVIGKTLRLPGYKLNYLVTGALLHDVGMLRIPDSITKKEGALTDDEMHKMRAHPLLSYRIITKELLYPDDVGLVGLQHHERWDGEGYPRKTAGEEIDPLARIVSVADAFEAMVSVKSYRNSMIGYTAMKNLLSDNSRRFDPEILKAFIKSMGIYPLGSTVLLNNAAIARVVENHAEAPLRPKLRVIVDEFGNRFEGEKGEVLDLLTEKTLFIARALDPKELGQ